MRWLEKAMRALGWTPLRRYRELQALFDLRDGEVERLRFAAKEAPVCKYRAVMAHNTRLMDENKRMRGRITDLEAQYADAVSRWAGLARLWQEEHGGGLVYVKGTADGGVQVRDEAAGEGCEPSAVIELNQIGKAVVDVGRRV